MMLTRRCNERRRPARVPVALAAVFLSLLMLAVGVLPVLAGFGTKTDFPAGSRPDWVAAADLNGDGKPDLAITNGNSSTVSVLLNTTPTNAATPSFVARQTFATGSSPVSVAAADLNGDGKPDLAVANQGSDTVSVLLANSSGTLQFSNAAFTVAAGGGTATLTLTRSGSTDGQVSAIVSLTGSTATQGTDFTFAAPETVTWADGDGADKTVTIPVTQDAIIEGDETAQFTLTLPANPSGAVLGAQTTTTLTITDDDAAGVTVTQTGGTAAVTEGGPTDSFTVVLTSQPTADVTVTMSPGTQVTTAPTPSLTFTPANWNVAQNVTVTAVNDMIAEGAHNDSIGFTVASADADYDNLPVADEPVAITDNDTAFIRINSISQVEGDGGTSPATFTVTLSPTSGQTVTVDFATANGTASAGSDFTATNGTLTFTPGETSKTVIVQIIGERDLEPDETVLVNLTNPTNATIAVAQGIRTILNDDTADTQPPDDSGRGTGKNKETDQGRTPTEEELQHQQHTNNSNRDQYHTEGHVAAVERTDDGTSLLVTIALGRDETLVVEIRCSSEGCPIVQAGDYLNADGEQGGREEQGRFIAENIEVTRNGRRVR